MIKKKYIALVVDSTGTSCIASCNTAGEVLTSGVCVSKYSYAQFATTAFKISGTADV